MEAKFSNECGGYAALCTNEKGDLFYQRRFDGHVMVWETEDDANIAKSAFLSGRQQRGRKIVGIEIRRVEKGFRQTAKVVDET